MLSAVGQRLASILQVHGTGSHGLPSQLELLHIRRAQHVDAALIGQPTAQPDNLAGRPTAGALFRLLLARATRCVRDETGNQRETSKRDEDDRKPLFARQSTVGFTLVRCLRRRLLGFGSRLRLGLGFWSRLGLGFWSRLGLGSGAGSPPPPSAGTVTPPPSSGDVPSLEHAPSSTSEPTRRRSCGECAVWQWCFVGWSLGPARTDVGLNVELNG